MSPKRYRTAVILALAHYVLALTVGASLHVHGDRGGHRGVAGCASPAAGAPAGAQFASLFDGASPCDRHDEGAAASGAGWGHSGECPVCLFLAQKPVPSHHVEAVACMEVVADAVPATAARGSAPVGSPRPIRGPPSVA